MKALNFWGAQPKCIISITWFLHISYFYIINIHHIPHQSQLHFGLGLEPSLLGTFGQRNHQWIVGSASSHRPHWRPDCCLPVAFGGSQVLRSYNVFFTVFWNSGYLKNRMMVLHLNWRCAGPFTEICVRKSQVLFTVSKQNWYVYIYILLYLYNHWYFYLFRKHLSTLSSFAQGLRLRMQGRKKRSKRAKVAWKVRKRRKRNGIGFVLEKKTWARAYNIWEQWSLMKSSIFVGPLHCEFR